MVIALKSDHCISIITPDEGRGTVVMEKHDYIQKLSTYLKTHAVPSAT